MTQYNTKNRIIHLYNKYLDQTISRSEFDELFTLIKDDKNVPVVESLINESILDRHNIDLFIELKSGSEYLEKDHRKKYFLWASMAAAVALIVTFAFFKYFGQNTYIIYQTGFQETKRVELPDGSSVMMNASSELKWKEGFQDEKDRIVFFRGEGFFDVSHQEGKKLIVKTEDVDVNVLGTKFNIESRSSFTKVFLQEGKVLLKAQETEDITMKPGDLVKYDEKKNTVEKLIDQSEEVSTSWTSGVFTFVDYTGWEILDKMKTIYGKEFIVEDSSGLNEIIVIQGLPYADWDFTREALELMMQKSLVESISNNIIVGAQ